MARNEVSGWKGWVFWGTSHESKLNVGFGSAEFVAVSLPTTIVCNGVPVSTMVI